MKKYMLIVTTLLIACIANSQESWKVVYQNNAANLVDIEYGSLSTGYAIGDNGFIIKTTNMGANWQEIGATDMGNLYLLEVVNADTVFVASQGKVYRSFNGGKNWKLIRSNASEVYTNMEHYDAVDNEQEYSSIFLAGENGLLARSIYFGDNWKVKPIYKYHRKKTLMNGYFGYSSDSKDTVIIYQYLGSDTIHSSEDNFRTMVRYIDRKKMGLGVFSKDALGAVTADKSFYMNSAFYLGDDGLLMYMHEYISYAKSLKTNTNNRIYDAEVHYIEPNLDSLTEDGAAARIVGVGDNGTVLLWGDRFSVPFLWTNDEMHLVDSIPMVDYKGATKGVDSDFPHLFHFSVCGEGVIVQRNFNGLTSTVNDVAEQNKIRAQLYPNPSKNHSVLVVYPSSTEEQEISLYDFQGHIIQTQSFEAYAKTPYTCHFNQDLVPGIYFVEVKGRSAQKVFKMVRL